MKKEYVSKIGFISIVLGIAIYIAAGPFLSLYSTRSAIMEKDKEKLSKNIDFTKLRPSLQEQINLITKQKIAELIKKHDPLAQVPERAINIMVDEIVKNLVTPDGVIDLVSGKFKLPFQGKHRSQVKLVTSNGRLQLVVMEGDKVKYKEDLSQDISYNYDSFNMFSAWMENDNNKKTRIILERYGLSWKITDIILPKFKNDEEV